MLSLLREGEKQAVQSSGGTIAELSRQFSVWRNRVKVIDRYDRHDRCSLISLFHCEVLVLNSLCYN